MLYTILFTPKYLISIRRMPMRLLFLLSLIFFQTVLFAQDFNLPNECHVLPPSGNVPSGGDSLLIQQRPPLSTTCDRSSAIYNSFFKKQESYVPVNGVTEPKSVVKKIKIRFVVLENDNTGSVQRNFRPSNVQDLYQLVDWVNMMMSDIATPTNPVSSVCGSCHIKDERVRIELTDVDFINDPTRYIYPTNTYLLPNQGKYKDSILNIYLYVDSSRYKADSIPPYFTPGAWAYLGGSLVGPSNSSQLSISMFNTYLSAKTIPQFEIGDTYSGILWGEAFRLMHELHHVLGLGHLQQDQAGNYGFDPGGCSGSDYLADAYPDGCPMSYSDEITNNIMNSAHWSNYLSPLQIGRVNRSCFLGAVSKYVYPTEDPELHPWVINSSQTWDFPIRMFQSIIVKTGATLTIKCEVQMPSNSRIFVEKGGKLIIDGGLVTSYNPKRTWFGIQLEGHHNAPPTNDYQGALIMKNGAIVENAHFGVANYDYLGNWHGGGIINAQNSTFYNCYRAAKLADYSYQSYNGAVLFDGVDFIFDNQDMPYSTAGMITTWAIKDGVIIRNCSFQNNVPAIPSIYGYMPYGQRGCGIYTEGTGMKISNNSFKGFDYGVFCESLGFISTRTTLVTNNDFQKNTRNITFTGNSYSSIRSNQISNMWSGPFSIPYAGLIGKAAYGIYLDGTAGTFVGCNNVVDGATNDPNAIHAQQYGILINSSRGQSISVMDNTFKNLDFGTQTQGMNLKLGIFCNDYQDNGFAWSLNPQTPNAWFQDHMGTGCNPNLDIRAENMFIGNNHDIYYYVTAHPFTYYAGNGPSNEIPVYNGGNVIVQHCNTDENSQCGNPFHCVYSWDNGLLNQVKAEYYIVKSPETPHLEAEANTLYGHIVRGYNDLNDYGGLKVFLESENDDKSRKLLIPLYIEMGLYSQVTPTINQLSVSEKEKSGYADYYGLLSSLRQQDRSPGALSATELNMVKQLAQENLEVTIYAKGLLSGYYNMPKKQLIEETPGIDAQAQSYKIAKGADMGSTLYNAIPNPANGKTTIQVYISKKDLECQPKLNIFTITGQQIFTRQLKGGINNIEINTNQLEAGIYFYNLNIRSHNIKTKKLSIIK